MSTVGAPERKVQNRVVQLFQKTLEYDYLGNWIDRESNSNIEESYLRLFLRDKQKYDEALITKAVQQLKKIAGDQTHSRYDVNKEVYSLLRYGIKVQPEIGENKQTVWVIDWNNPGRNHFAIAEEVTVEGENDKRPDIVLYVNGIAVGVLELKRSTVSVSEGIRQNLDNQKNIFIGPFFSTIQLVMAGNDTQGLRYATIETKEKYFLNWKEPDEEIEADNQLDPYLCQLCEKRRLLEIIHDFIVFDAGVKKICRHNQYFGVKAAQPFILRNEGGIIWHTQGSGKSLTMIWLAKWIRENVTDSRVLVLTDRKELDEQIEKFFLGVKEEIYRTTSGADLIKKLNRATPWLMCSLIHKFGGKDDDTAEPDITGYIEEVHKALPVGFEAKGNICVFIDECHRTQSGELHKAMKQILPNALFIGFTGTPLLKKDKQTSIDVFGRYIHTYKYDEAVADRVVLDLRYEARNIDQDITSPEKIDQWFEAKTRGLNDIARAELKKRWGTMQKVLSSRERLAKIVNDIQLDMNTRPRLMSGRGNALLITNSIFEACKCYELFTNTDLAGKCAIVTSYKPSPADIKGEESGEGLTERLRQYAIYQKMLADYFRLPAEEAVKKADLFEKEVKKKFVHEPGQMKLLIVVDKLLTGFDAPSATYLYIDKQMRDHGLFQAICRVNRLDDDDKDYGYIIDYMDLFRSLERAIDDYTTEAFDGYDKKDVEGLLSNRLTKAREHLEEALETIRAICEHVALPHDTADYIRYFCAKDTTDKDALKENEPKRLTLYKAATALLRAYANIANEMGDAGYTAAKTEEIRKEVEHYNNVRKEIKCASGDYIDLKQYEPAMRHLIDAYIRAEDSEKISAFDDMTLIQMIVERGTDAVKALPKGIRTNQDAVAETIENNIRRLIVDESPINPKYYEKMSHLLDALIIERRSQVLGYKAYLKKIVELTKQVKNPDHGGPERPRTLDTPAKRALFDNLNNDENLALKVDNAVRSSKQDDWEHNTFKTKRVRFAIKDVLKDNQLTDRILDLVKNQQEYK
jgi:type I restriction enzyme R subunit